MMQKFITQHKILQRKKKGKNTIVSSIPLLTNIFIDIDQIIDKKECPKEKP
jgi:hypothetical protein